MSTKLSAILIDQPIFVMAASQGRREREKNRVKWGRMRKRRAISFGIQGLIRRLEDPQAIAGPST